MGRLSTSAKSKFRLFLPILVTASVLVAFFLVLQSVDPQNEGGGSRSWQARQLDGPSALPESEMVDSGGESKRDLDSANPVESNSLIPAEVARIKNELKSLDRQYRKKLEEVIDVNPESREILMRRTEKQEELSDLLSQKMNDKLLRWLSDCSQSPGGLESRSRKLAEMEGLRHFYASHVIKEKLNDPEMGSVTRRWLKYRFGSKDSGSGLFFNNSAGWDLRYNPVDLLPSEGVVRAIENSGDAERFLSEYASELGIDSIDRTFPEGGELFVFQATELAIERDLLEFQLHEEFPDLRQIREYSLEKSFLLTELKPSP